MIYHLCAFFFFLPIAIRFLYGLTNKCLRHEKLGLCMTCANGTFFTHPSISQTGCFPHRGQQTSSSISWVWRLSLPGIRSVCGSEAALTPSSVYNTRKSGSGRSVWPGQRCQSAAGREGTEWDWTGRDGTARLGTAQLGTAQLGTACGACGARGAPARPAARARPHGNAPPQCPITTQQGREPELLLDSPYVNQHPRAPRAREASRVRRRHRPALAER